MLILHRISGVIRSLAGRGPVQRELDEEVDGYFDMLVEENVARGMDIDEARRRALLDMGGAEQVKESVRAARPAAWLDTILRDIRHGARLLRKTPAFSLTAILVLALGVGANSAIFGLINILLLQPLPGGDKPGQLVSIHTHDPAKPDSYRSFTYPEYEDIRDNAGTFDHVMAHRTLRAILTEGEAMRHMEAALVTSSYFDTLGVNLAAGRTFSRDEERPGGRAAVMILSHSGWQKLGARPDILGRTLQVNSQPFTVVGIAPDGFAGASAVMGPGFWLPLGAADLLPGGSNESPASQAPGRARAELLIVGRLKPRLSVASANAAMRAFSAGRRQTLPRGAGSQLITVARLARLGDGESPQADAEDELILPLGALMGAALIVLLIASLNVANMQLARGTGRRKEIAMRLALGAGRCRVIGQLMTEGIMLAISGGAVGLLLGVWTMHMVAASLEPLVPMVLAVNLAPDWRLYLASLIFSSLAAIGCGLGPAWKLSRLDLIHEIKGEDGSGAGSRLRRFGPRNLLVAGQIALSLALLAASGLFVRGAVVAGRADPGYRFDNQFLLRVYATPGVYSEVSGPEAYRRLMDRIRSTPGIESAAMASIVAFSNDWMTRRVSRSEMAAAAEPGVTLGTSAYSYNVGAAYFQTLGLSMRRGREFTEAEELDSSASGVVIIDELLAAALFPGQDPLGRSVQLGEKGATMQIVGVAPGLRARLTDRGPVPHVYLPLGSNYGALVNIHTRITAAAWSDINGMRLMLRQLVRLEDARLAVLAVQTLEEARDAAPKTWIIRSAGRLFGAFGVMALFMATIGIYGVKAYLVAGRTREIGIRLALGATACDVIRMVLWEGVALLAVSIVVGFLLAVGAGQAISSLLVGVNAFDPLVLSIATLALSLAVLAACYVPVRRAIRISPMTALRDE